MEIITIIFGIIFIIVFLVMANNIGKIKEILRVNINNQIEKVVDHLTSQKYIVYMTISDEWVEYRWNQISVNVAYIKCLMFEDGFEVRKKTRDDIDVYGNYHAMKRVGGIKEAKTYYLSLLPGKKHPVGKFQL